MASVSGVNPPPSCLLCGLEVPGMIHSQKVNPTCSGVLFRENQWKHHKKDKVEHVMVPSKQVEEVDFAKYPSMWSCICRASESYQSVVGPVHPNRISNQRA